MAVRKSNIVSATFIVIWVVGFWFGPVMSISWWSPDPMWNVLFPLLIMLPQALAGSDKPEPEAIQEDDWRAPEAFYKAAGVKRPPKPADPAERRLWALEHENLDPSISFDHGPDCKDCRKE